MRDLRRLVPANMSSGRETTLLLGILPLSARQAREMWNLNVWIIPAAREHENVITLSAKSRSVVVNEYILERKKIC
jgi:hypothetical protein